MKVTKIVDAPVIDSNGKWNVYCQVLRGSAYQYGVIVCNTKEEAFGVKEGQTLDTERFSFEHRTKNV